jgi:hypothetical protein
MRLIHESRAIQVFLDDLVYLAARLKSEPSVADLAAPIETMIAEGRKRRDEVEQAKQKVLVALAQRVAEDERLDDDLLALGRAALDAAKGRRDADPYQRLFRRAPSELAALALGDQLAEVQRIEAELTALDAPFAARATQLAEQRKRTEDAIAAHAQAEIAFDRTRTDVRLFKQECNRARRRVEGGLLQRLPVSRRRIATFFKAVNDASVVEDIDEPAAPPPAAPSAVAPG